MHYLKVVSLSAIFTAIAGCGESASNIGASFFKENTPPNISTVSFTVNEDQMLRDKVLATDADNQTLHYEVINTTRKGRLTVNQNAQLQYVPHVNFNGTDTATLRISDGIDHSDFVLRFKVAVPAQSASLSANTSPD